MIYFLNLKLEVYKKLEKKYYIIIQREIIKEVIKDLYIYFSKENRSLGYFNLNIVVIVLAIVAIIRVI